MSKKLLLAMAGILVVIAVLSFVLVSGKSKDQGQNNRQNSDINSFEACKAAGNPIQESYPEQCSANGKSYTNPTQSVNPE